MSNKLVNTTSPYLLQHAENPVEWYPWGEEALERARTEDKPIFLSIGYSACHWCHVMAHESFEDSQVAAIMNRNFINIKVDREERPDLDGIYMAAVVAMTGQGGWPMSVFLTPALIPFYGGTYFPPQSRYGMPAFKDVLNSLAALWQNDRGQILQAGNQLASIIFDKAARQVQPGSIPTEALAKAANELIKNYDWEHGGWGRAPKFPQPMALRFLLHQHVHGDESALEPVEHALNVMARGGMYDVVGGGFARYSTDDNWFIPHFEKMLYDNAQLVQVYLHAWQITRDPGLKDIVEGTLAFVIREMLSPEGGFYSSLDADSEGEEGKFYVWTLDEIREGLGGKNELFETAYGITDPGNWEGKVVLRRVESDTQLANHFTMKRDEVQKKLKEYHTQLLEMRDQRVRPGRDDKVLTAWNGLMLSTFAQAARFLGNGEYLRIAQKNANFLLTSLIDNGELRRTWRNGQIGEHVFLEDYAALILGLIDLYQADFDNRWYVEAYKLTEEMIQKFNDPAGGFFDTTREAQKVLIRPKELQDNATPSGNALAAEALLIMASFSENEQWRQLAERSLGLVAGMAATYPTGYGRWLSAAAFNLGKTKQIAIIGDLSGDDAKTFLHDINKDYRPNTIMAASNLPLSKRAPNLLTDRPMIGDKTTVYVCEGFMCKRPVTSLEGLKAQLGG